MDAPETGAGDQPILTAEAASSPWGFWATLGFSFLILAAFFLAQTVGTVGYFAVSAALEIEPGLDRSAEQLSKSGLFLSVVAWTAASIGLGLVVLVARLRRGWSAAEYLALRPVPMRTLGAWVGIVLAYCVATDSLTYLLGRPIVPEFMREAYQTAYWASLLWGALVVAAPAFEESFFRGFMLRGLRGSRLGATGSVLATSAVWTALHVQYDAYFQAILFLGGILLGVARLRSRSLYPPLAMHATMNLLATLEVAWVVRS